MIASNGTNTNSSAAVYSDFTRAASGLNAHCVYQLYKSLVNRASVSTAILHRCKNMAHCAESQSALSCSSVYLGIVSQLQFTPHPSASLVEGMAELDASTTKAAMTARTVAKEKCIVCDSCVGSGNSEGNSRKTAAGFYIVLWNYCCVDVPSNGYISMINLSAWPYDS
ncbi:hypothetical protein EV424DRAFT_117779 [Suillus variegatus]|nr:hypothetical protein EV424DRAFT_117779 [Suillus variegatus]